MKALIVDDEPLARNELGYLLNEIGGFDEVNEAENVTETLEALLLNHYDIIFLDINLMDENGIELGSKIQKMKNPPAIIFATAHDQYAVQAFELNATDYILKPFGQQRVEQAINKVKTQQQITGNQSTPKVEAVSGDFEQSLPVEIDDKIHMLKQKNIIGIGTHNGITTIHTTNHQYETTEPLNRYEKRLDQSHFLRIHRSYIINKKHIKEVQQWFNYTYMVILTNGVKMQVGRSFMKEFKAWAGLV
ncbi:response regulator transcription factor LytR [Staphylococcus simiae]|uniref:response regulator transcription factor LytR n=1 Tax=Staphylococcus simiae TaxID=308354 RepID=UPI001A95F5A4|nr:response regulator transcription factor LytR [Staphylococcus simiae]MBO1199419.1 response regulator transcription factor LytR [Staphylococcus simiae]MBO1201888.1 response regulator transcription factor LytR [Staphylococcus simiae]MBO1204102.1 response regulator transcription factor LytR [Staphylococcus simiae]MBO1211131.1 response regulator transcription factor LytR [Staphylococcus simiae]MBO1230337.1 response regulator transcription factor LytR [Staphylococcus simiae]